MVVDATMAHDFLRTLRIEATPGAAERFLRARTVVEAKVAFANAERAQGQSLDGGAAVAGLDERDVDEAPSPRAWTPMLMRASPGVSATASYVDRSRERSASPSPSPSMYAHGRFALATPGAAIASPTDVPVQSRDGRGRERVWLGPASPSQQLHSGSPEADIVPTTQRGESATIVARVAAKRVKAPHPARFHIDGSSRDDVTRKRDLRDDDAVRVVERVVVFHDEEVTSFRDPNDRYRNKAPPDRHTEASLAKRRDPDDTKRGDARVPGSRGWRGTPVKRDWTIAGPFR